MTEKEIKKLSRKYVEEKLSDALKFFPTQLPDSMEVLVKREQESVSKVIEWLSKDYCIVPKEVIRKRYENAKSTHELYTSATCINNMESRAIDHAEGRMCELNTLFGTALFNEEKE